MITWRRLTNSRLEQVRLHVSGIRIKAYGRIISAEPEQEPYSASYELITNDIGVTKRLSIHLVRAGGESQVAISRDGENNWLVQTAEGTVHSDFNGAQDIDIAMSPMFKSLPIRRLGLHRDAAGEQSIPVVYVYLPETRVEGATMTYNAGADAIDITTPIASTAVTVDDNGFVLDYAGISTRI
ncbi:putative glycolipid-binding domain-containing protein [Gordonia asplenii]|nr:putative glycolipid-binding domain-containing protein [Gordonia asplenii]